MTKMFQENNVALYCRLSREDGDSVESSSIKTQKEILTDYANKNNWNIFRVYVDDGYSGGNFNRPAFKEMINDIEQGKINIVLTKDLSRLGRNYIQTGYYTEEFFPKLNIRYIAINDNYDSNSLDNDFTPFKNIINQWYLKDLSKKVKSAHDNRIKKGLLPLGNNVALFGYKNINGKREIDERSANIVRLIFNLYTNKMIITDIIKYLYENKIINISYYNYITYNANASYWISAKEDSKYIWPRMAISNILSNEEYTGKLILQKRKTISYKTHERKITSKEERKVFDDVAPAIIDKDTFEKAQEIRRLKCYSKLSEDENKYKGFLLCANCGKVMNLKKNNEKKTPQVSYICRNKNCDKHVRVSVNILDKSIYEIALLIFNKIISEKDKILQYAKDYKGKNKNKTNNHLKDIESLSERNNKLNLMMQSLFERNFANELPTDTYQKILQKYKKEYYENEEKIKELKLKSLDKHEINYYEQTKKLIDNLENKEFNLETIKCFIKHIFIKRVDKKLVYKISFYKVPDMLEDYFNND